MRLISCHIINFGKLTNFNFDFDKNLIVLKAENSFGKTTLASFITSMFYGLPTKQKKIINENDRIKYDPWQSGSFGGNIVFEYDKLQYKVERDFNKKNDDFKVTDMSTKREIDKIGKVFIDSTNFGDVLFGINRDSYKRSVYIPQDEIVCSDVESGLNDKLRNLINATEENLSFDKSIDLLDRVAKAIEAPRGSGKLKEVLQRIYELNNEIEVCKICAKNSEVDMVKLKKLKEELVECDKKANELEKQIQSLNETETILAQQKYFYEIKEVIKNNEIIIARSVPFFKNLDIDKIDLDVIKNKIDKVEEQKKVVKDLEDKTLQERTNLQSLESINKVKQENKNLLNTQLQGYLSDKKRVTSKIKKINFFIILLCIITFGIFFLYIKMNNKQQKIKIIEIDKEIVSIQKEIDQIDNLQNVNNDNKLVEIKLKLETEETLYKKLTHEVNEVLQKFDCKERDYLSCFHEIKENYKELLTTQKSLLQNKEKLKEFLKDKNHTKLMEKIDNNVSIEELKSIRIKNDNYKLKLVEEISNLKNNIEKNDESADEIPIYESELTSLNETKEELEKEFRIINHTKHFLLLANDKLANQYLTPLKEESKKIIRLYDSDKSIIDFDADTKIKITEQGKERELDYFSKGIKELVSICMRFALIDIIFQKSINIPCVILDDPFVNFDDNKLEKAKKFIKNLSKKYQIIYLTCHDSRKIEM